MLVEISVIVSCLSILYLGHQVDAINYNGSGLREVALPDEAIRAESWFFSREIVTVQGGDGMRYCRPGTNYVSYTSVAVQV